MSLAPKQRYFGFKGGWLVFWITVACATDMTLFGYDQVSKDPGHEASLSKNFFDIGCLFWRCCK